MSTVATSRKWAGTISISLSNIMAYKFNFITMIVVPPLIFLLIKLNVWESIYNLKSSGLVAGIDRSSMFSYQAWVFLVSLLGQSYVGIKIAEDIRMGRMSAYLIYPFGFWQYHFCAFIAHQMIQVVIFGLGYASFLALGLVQMIPLSQWIAGFGISFTVGMLWFLFQSIVALLTFWIEEVWVLRACLFMIAQVATGALFPISFFPEAVQLFLKYTPFPYIIFYPAQIFSGNITESLLSVFCMLLIWIVVLWGVTSVIWRRGMREYSGVGI